MADFVETAKVSPPTKLFIRSKEGLSCFLGPNPTTPIESTTIHNPYRMETDELLSGRTGLQLPPIFSPDGSLICMVHDSGRPLVIVDSGNGSVVGEIPCLDAQYIEWSPLGKYVVTWSRPSKTSGAETSEGNLRVWKLSSFSMVVAYNQRQYRKEIMQWSSDESMCFRIVSNEIHILDGQDLSRGILNKIHHKGLVQFKIANSTPVMVAVFNPEAGGNPARCTLYSCRSVTDPVLGPISSRTMFAASEASLLWNKQGTALVVHTQSDVDSSNLSYYGATGLFLLTADGAVSAVVSQSKEGPIHDVKWSPVGDTFVVAAGHMPCNCTQYNAKGEGVYEFGSAHRNTVSWSPHGRFLCLAGFGNLAGEMDFYDTKKKNRKIGSNSAHCTVSFGWSPCSRYFMAATLAPRMNVDNGFKLFTCEGIGPVFELKKDFCFDAVWRPSPAALYPDKGPNATASAAAAIGGGGSVPAPVAVSKPAAYRPPGSSGALAGLIRRERESGGAAPGKPGAVSSSASQQNKKSSVDNRPQQRLIPGMPPPPP
eukprot:gene4104-8160_t